MNYIENYFIEKKLPFCFNTEPGGTPLAEKIRQLLITVPNVNETMMPQTELLLMFAVDRSMLQTVILPALQTGNGSLAIVLLMQVMLIKAEAGKCQCKKLKCLTQWIVHALQPRLTILLDAPPEIGLAREKSPAPYRIEQEKHDFFERVTAVYLQRAHIS